MAPNHSIPSSLSNKDFQNMVTQPMTLSKKKALVKQLQDADTISSLRRPQMLMLMDFFADCLSTSNLALAVPALPGLVHLITVCNLDYPDIYARLYALLDNNLLHSKYRSRILRHLDNFLAPTNHLPVTIVASFIKRLSRLCLYAPPSAIVAIVPFIYNLLRSFPTTTFMIHRNPHPPYTKTVDNLGVDPYNSMEKDPRFSNAIDSSLWELETLQSHYYPQVATLCRIISEQFTKPQYNIEDFLDHGYGTLVEAELRREGKEVPQDEKRRKEKKPPVVEYRIPKRIFIQGTEGVEDQDRSLVTDLWSFE